MVAVAFAGAGMMKLTTSYMKMITNPDMAWTRDFSETQIKIIGALEVLGAIGVIAPMFVKKFGYLVPIAAMGLALTMIGAALTHIGRGEYEALIPNIVLFGLAAYVANTRKGMLKK